MSTRTLGTNLNKIVIKIHFFFHENAFENAIYRMAPFGSGTNVVDKQRDLMHGHQGWNVRHGLCHIYMRYVYIYIYIYIWVVYSLCFFCCLFITVTWWYVWCIEWASGNQEEVQACLVILWLFIISCYSLYKTALGLLRSWFENNPHFHKYSIDFHIQCVYLNYFFLWEIWLK